MPARPWAKALDMYRKVPADLLEGTMRGSLMSWFALFAMASLAFLETRDFLSSTMVKDLSLDSNRDEKVRVNFNVTMMDVRCDYATVDVVSVLGTEQNVTQHVTKFAVTPDGVRKMMVNRNLNQNDIDLHDVGVTETLEELHENGEDAVSLDPTTLKFAMHQYEFLLVDFYASWCSHCRDLAPTWEVLAEVMTDAAQEKVDDKIEGREHEYSDEDYEEAVKLELPVMVAKVDCVVHQALCMEQNIMGYPTIRLFHNGEYKSDYRGHRTVVEMTHWLANLEEQLHEDKPEEERKTDIASADEIARDRMSVSTSRDDMNAPPKRPRRTPDGDSPEEIAWAEVMRKHRSRQRGEWRDEDHPGCQLSGFLMVDRAPGHFHIQARSKHHDIAAHMTNVSHEVHHLSFGDLSNPRAIQTAEKIMKERGVTFPPGLLDSTHPMDGNIYITRNVHEAHHHYLKVITNNFDKKTEKIIKDFRSRARVYSILQSSQLSFFRSDIVPEAKFSYDLSPIAVAYRERKRHWYDYVTSLMAIMGGTFTVVGMLDNVVGAASGGRRKGGGRQQQRR